MFSPVSFLGDTMLTNGTLGAYHEVTTELVRLRILNGSNARAYNFGFDDDREFAQDCLGRWPAADAAQHGSGSAEPG